MKYHSDEMISVGDRVKYNGQEGCVALVAGESRSGSPLIKWEEWTLNEGEVLILFNNGALLRLDDVQNEEDLVFQERIG
jgi:hypothetical protein